MKQFTPFFVCAAILAVWVILLPTQAQTPSATTPFSCTVTLSTNTTTQCQIAAPGKLRNYVQGYQIVTTTAGTTTTVGINYGTGTNCGTGTTALSPVYPNTTITPANSAGTLANLGGAGLVPPVANAVCAVQAGTTPGTSVVTIWGYIGQ